MIEQVEYGPFDHGYVAALDRTRVGRRAITEDSRDCGIDPMTFAVTTRPGSAVKFDTAGALVGLLEAKFGSRLRQLLVMESLSFQDGEPNLAGLWTDETDKEGALWWRSSNGADSNQQIGKSYSLTHRSKTTLTPWNLLMIPIWSEHATDKWSRCKDSAQRKVVCSGSRKVLRVREALVAPNYQGTPLWHNGRFNDATGSGSEKEYVRPLGPMGPIFPIRRTGVSASSSQGTLIGKDTFWIGYCYQYENGETSEMHIPTAPITVNSGASTTQYEYVSLFVPPGPPDCVARLIFRTNKWDGSAGTPTVLDPTVMLFSDVIRNNFQTSYNYYGGDDDHLRDRPDLYHPDLIMPPRARNVCTMDGRIVFFDLKINTAVIQLAPYSADGNMLDSYMYSDTGAYGNTFFYWRNDGTNITLKHQVNPGYPAATTDLTIALSGLTLKGVVDAINAVGTTAGLWSWRARLLPGVDGNALATGLETTSGADYFDDDGANGANDATSGNQRVIAGQTLPGVMNMSKTSPWATGGDDKRALHFTMANPAATGTAADAPLAPNAWRGGFDCRRRLEGGMGRLIGGASLLNGALCFASNGLGILRNVRGGKTGVDSDYRLETWKRGGGSGLVSPWAFAEGDGWGVYAERQGIMVNDGEEDKCISWRVWNHKANNGSGMGPWAYEMAQCKKWVGADTDVGNAQLHVSVAGARIYVAYRSSGSVTYPDMYMYYDFSASQHRIGVKQLFRTDENGDEVPFPWSAPIRIRGSQVALVPRSDGDHIYTSPDDLGAAHSTGDGTVVEIELTSTNADDGVQQTMTAYLQTDRFESERQKKRVHKVDVEYYDPDGLLALAGAYDFARSTSTAIATLPAVSDGTISGVARQRTPAALRGPVNTMELKLSGALTHRSEIRRLKVGFRRLNTTKPDA